MAAPRSPERRNTPASSLPPPRAWERRYIQDRKGRIARIDASEALAIAGVLDSSRIKIATHGEVDSAYKTRWLEGSRFAAIR